MNDNTNPANEQEKSKIPAGYIPMSAPTQRLQVPEIPGYQQHWFRGDAGRIQRAMQAGYEFVRPEEVVVNNFDLGGDAKDSGNSDMGTRVSITSGDEGERLYLMKVPDHLYEHSQKILHERNESIAESLRSGLIGSDKEGHADRNARYTKQQGVPDLFNPNKRRR